MERSANASGRFWSRTILDMRNTRSERRTPFPASSYLLRRKRTQRREKSRRVLWHCLCSYNKQGKAWKASLVERGRRYSLMTHHPLKLGYKLQQSSLAHANSSISLSKLRKQGLRASGSAIISNPGGIRMGMPHSHPPG